MSLSPAFLDELRARTALSTLLGRTVKLQRAGAEWKACCPFHNEKTPSFYVNDQKGFWHCFGCGVHGDAIRWLTDSRGMQFMDAVKELAEAAGMEVPAADPRDAERRERQTGMHEIMQRVADAYVGFLGYQGNPARLYLEERGIEGVVANTFNLGFAPDSRTAIRAALSDVGDDRLVELGMLVRPGDDREPYDRFRNRIIIPIHDPRGRVVGFGGRLLGKGEPKYLNSPDTPLFDKGRSLFNVHRASPAARRAGRLIVVEGYMDVIALHRAGLEEAVAPNGTALTEHQMGLLWRISDQPILCFDGDAAGKAAASRAALKALPLLEPGRTLWFASPPPGLDPDDVLREHGPAAVANLFAKPRPLAEVVWSHELELQPLVTPEARAGLRARLEYRVAAIRDPAVRDAYREQFAQRYAAVLAPRPPSQRRRAASGAARAIAARGIGGSVEMAVLIGLLRYPDVLLEHAEDIAAAVFSIPEIAEARNSLLAAVLTGAESRGSFENQLVARGHEEVVRRLAAPPPLPFSFLKHGAPRAREDLVDAIRTMRKR